jgi:hypothetical protein
MTDLKPFPRSRYPWIRKRGGLRALRANLNGCGVIWILLLGTALGSILLAKPALPWALLQLCAVLPLAWLVLQALTYDPPPMLIATFSQRLGPRPFSVGRSVAALCPGLDEEARDLGVLPLSEFGFTHPHLDPSLATWHEPERGLSTFRALLQSAEERNRADEEQLRRELASIVSDLELAESIGARFCLLVPNP